MIGIAEAAGNLRQPFLNTVLQFLHPGLTCYGCLKIMIQTRFGRTFRNGCRRFQPASGNPCQDIRQSCCRISAPPDWFAPSSREQSGDWASTVQGWPAGPALPPPPPVGPPHRGCCCLHVRSYPCCRPCGGCSLPSSSNLGAPAVTCRHLTRSSNPGAPVVTCRRRVVLC